MSWSAAGALAPRGVEEGERADDVGLHERRRPVDGAVDVALGREVHDAVGPVLREEARDLGRVADVDGLEPVAVACSRVAYLVEVAGVRQHVHIDDRVVGLGDKVADERGADKASSAGHEKGFHAVS